MTTREKVLTILLGVLGIVAAGAIALAANAISGDSIGLSAQPVSLASGTPKPEPAPGAKAERRGDFGDHSGGSDESSGSDDSGSVSSSGSSDGPSTSSGTGSATGGDDRHKGSALSPSSGPGPAPTGAITTTTTDDHGGGGGPGPSPDSGGTSGGTSGPG